MKRIDGQLLLLVTMMLVLASCGPGDTSPGDASPYEIGQAGERQVCSASILTLDGSRIELSEVTSQAYMVSQINPRIFGAVSVALRLAEVEWVKLVQGSDRHEIQLRGFTSLTGYVSGSIAGKEAQGDQQVDWTNIREAEVRCEPEQVEYAAPPGVDAAFYDAAAGSMRVYGLRVMQSYCTPSGEPVNGYQVCIEGSTTEEVLRVNVTQDGKVYREYEIPLAALTAMSWADGIQYQSRVLGAQTLRGEFHSAWALRPEGSQMAFLGENAFGTWTIYPTGDFRIDFPESIPLEPHAETPDTAGSCTTLEGETFGIVGEHVDSIPLRVNGSTLEVAWEQVGQMRLWRENSWLAENGHSYMMFRQTVEITQVDGQTLRGEADLEEGFITAISPDGVRVNIPLYGLAEITLER